MDVARSGHVAGVVIVPHRAGPMGWSTAMEGVADALQAHPAATVTVRLPGAALEHVVTSQPRLWEVLAAADIAWLAGGWSDPVLPDLPLPAARRQLDRERTAIDAARLNPVGLWLGDSWERYMAVFALESGYRLVYLDSSLVTGPNDRPGATDRAGDTVIVVPVAPEWPIMAKADGLTAVRVEPGELSRFWSENLGRLTNPDRYLAEHGPGPLVTPSVAVPVRVADAEPYYRKLLRLIADTSDRGVPSDLLLGLESREFTTGSGAGPDADLLLLDARNATDRAAHRGEDWVRVQEVDWDGDGTDEVQIETSKASVVIDPAQGLILTWDDKEGRWPITSVTPVLPGVLSRLLDGDGTETEMTRLRMDRRTEARGEVRIRLDRPEGGSCQVVLSGRALTIETSPVTEEPVRLGPELPLRLDGSSTRIRVDGGEWRPITEPVAVAGHRFRLTDDDRALLITSPRPCTLFVNPLPGFGLVVWPHWTASPSTGEYRVTFTPQ